MIKISYPFLRGSVVFICCFITSSLTFAQTKTFKWTTELCNYEGVYDVSKVTEQQLKNTYDLWFNNAYTLQTDATVWKPEELPNLSLDRLNKEYTTNVNKLKELDIVKLPCWEKLKEETIKEIEECYKLKAVTIKAYNHPEVLKEYSQGPGECQKYADALIAGGDKMLAVWKEMEETQCKTNASPQNCVDRFMNLYNSSQKMEYAKIRLMAFGWWNCNNQQIPYLSRDVKMEEEFQKLFKNVKFECDEP
ncbi:hypothetical protein [Solitalea canadensis]|uniref:Uncharacterized protein n=1 Tax=Solitalea canadensis (strain ATCC 29591 / DSM 3403 / JCM 21819 / LMG 8368 / NBRC 15130 / NCIMB 12057 / USAM 9D) TaxID=929556 RepID=H8KM84_SOLCM|nr:hypothetical protein [Solitalea canadensis]AFD09266.1 hypothetical protein Solca_4276 [Solitalea canadensis DSM 3403]